MYEEAIRVPLIVSDPHRQARRACPNSVRHQLTSSVDVAPLLLTLAQRLRATGARPALRAISRRAPTSLAIVARSDARPGARYALHATDEVLTEFALLPYAAHAPLHVKGIITPNAKYATYTHWQPDTTEPLAARRGGRALRLHDPRRLPRDRQPGRAQRAQRMRCGAALERRRRARSCTRRSRSRSCDAQRARARGVPPLAPPQRRVSADPPPERRRADRARHRAHLP